MQYGLLGEKLKHSFSKDIHELLGSYTYSLTEVPPSDLQKFMEERNFLGINVTIPYKESVIPYLDKIDESAKKIGAVNTVVNRNGKLIGYNTDIYGLKMLIKKAKINVTGKKVAILGTGGTSKTARAALCELSAREIITVSRNPSDGEIGYEDLYNLHADIDVLVNTTPVGMYPKNDECPIDIDKFSSLSGVIDVVYNPLSTTLINNAKKRKIHAEGGLFMLVAQAIRASEIFLSTKYPPETTEKIFRNIVRQKKNIVLIGMPASGKSTVGRILKKELSRPLIDTDKVIEKRCNMRISEIFEKHGEKYFRDIEAEVIAEVSKESGIIIATGGGSILREESVDNLKQNGKLYFIDRPLSKLIPTATRPLASTAIDIEKRYNERYGIYSAASDVRIDANASAPITAKKVKMDFLS